MRQELRQRIHVSTGWKSQEGSLKKATPCVWRMRVTPEEGRCFITELGKVENAEQAGQTGEGGNQRQMDSITRAANSF